MEANAVRFANAARVLGEVARDGGLTVPTFRSPPRGHGVRRSLRRRVDGTASVAVALRGRPWGAVVADMIDGIITANGLGRVEAGEWRDRFWIAVVSVGEVGADLGEAA